MADRLFCEIGNYDKIKKFKKYSKVAMLHNKRQTYNNKSKCRIIQIDEMYTFIGDRQNRAYIALAVSGWGQILSFVCGYSKDDILKRMLMEIKSYVSDNTIFYFDDNLQYPPLVNRFYPNADYVNMRGREADPYLSQLNFVCALVRNRLGRMNRKSWCFSRSLERLQLNLELLKSNFNRKFNHAS